MCESRRDGRCSCCERGVLGREGVIVISPLCWSEVGGPGGSQVGSVAFV